MVSCHSYRHDRIYRVLSEPQKKLRNELVKTLTKLIVLSAFPHSFLTILSKPALLDVTISRFLRNSPFTVSNGVAAGDSIHLCLRNSPGFVALWLATAKLGAWMVPVDPASSSRDIETQLGRVTPKIGFYAAQRGNCQASRQDFNVLVDGTVVGSFTPSGTTYQSFTTAAFTVTAVT